MSRKKNQNQNQDPNQDPNQEENKDLLNLEDQEPGDDNPDSESNEPTEDELQTQVKKGEFDQASYDRFVELKFIAIRVGGTKNLKPEYRKEVEGLTKKVMANPGIKALDNKTVHVRGEVVKLVSGVPVSDRVYNLFTDDQKAQYFES